MEIKTFRIGNANAYLKAYIHEQLPANCSFGKDRPAIMICPGGGYERLSARETDPVALPLFAAGYQIFILYYSVKEDIRMSRPEEEAADAIKLIREKSGELDVDSSKVAIMGFSAGAHVSASLLCHHRRYGDASRPTLGILCYPVITTGEGCHKGSVKWITDNGDKALMEYYSLEKQVCRDTPPCFIWHTVEDQTVPVSNSLKFVEALLEKNVSVEYHMYRVGKHGLSTAKKEVGTELKEVQSWMDLLLNWLRSMLDFSI